MSDDQLEILRSIARKGLRDIKRNLWPFPQDSKVMYMHEGQERPAKVLFCTWEPGWREWNVCLKDAERNISIFLPAKHLIAQKDYLAGRILTTKH